MTICSGNVQSYNSAEQTVVTNGPWSFIMPVDTWPQSEDLATGSHLRSLATSQDHIINICSLPCHLPQKVNGEAGKEVPKLLEKASPIFAPHAPSLTFTQVSPCTFVHPHMLPLVHARSSLASLHAFPNLWCTSHAIPWTFVHPPWALLCLRRKAMANPFKTMGEGWVVKKYEIKQTNKQSCQKNFRVMSMWSS